MTRSGAPRNRSRRSRHASGPSAFGLGMTLLFFLVFFVTLVVGLT